MFDPPEGIQSIATASELRADPSEIMAKAQESGKGILIMKYQKVEGVILSFERYKELIENEE